MEPESIHVTAWGRWDYQSQWATKLKFDLRYMRVSVRDKPESYRFNQVFGIRTKQHVVLTSLTDRILADVDSGYNSTLLVYGQSGTVKTTAVHGRQSSDQGWEEDPDLGIIPRTICGIFEKLEKSGNKFAVKVSFLQIYNEELFDLLNPTGQDTLEVFKDPSDKRSVIVKGLKEIAVRNKNEAYNIWENGEAALMDHHFSKSHSIFSLKIYMTEKVDGEELIQIGKINLVDVAGSENVGPSAVDSAENRSLSTLKRVVAALAEKEGSVPYGDSLLTRLLKDSLGGRARTSVLAVLPLESEDLQEAQRILEFATAAKDVWMNHEQNPKRTRKEFMQVYREETDRLRREKEGLEGRLLTKRQHNAREAELRVLEKKIAAYTKKMQLMDEDLDTVTEILTPEAELEEGETEAGASGTTEEELPGAATKRMQAQIQDLEEKLRLMKIQSHEEKDKFMKIIGDREAQILNLQEKLAKVEDERKRETEELRKIKREQEAQMEGLRKINKEQEAQLEGLRKTNQELRAENMDLKLKLMKRDDEEDGS